MCGSSAESMLRGSRPTTREALSVTESQDPSLPDTEASMLMPQSSPRPASRRPKGRLANGARPYSSDRSEHEYAALADQLDALEDDIHHARESSTEAQRAPGMTAHLEAEAPTPSPRGESVALADGARILIRPVEPHDAQQLKTGFEHLSAVSRYRRFLTEIDHLSERQLAYLTDVDHERHEALIALDAATGEGVGIARFVRDPNDPTQAEVAVMVADPWQGRGVGSALIERLAARARAAGVERFTARMLIGNHAGHRLFVQVADEISEHEDAGTIELTARLRTYRQETSPTRKMRFGRGWTATRAAVRKRMRKGLERAGRIFSPPALRPQGADSALRNTTWCDSQAMSDRGSCHRALTAIRLRNLPQRSAVRPRCRGLGACVRCGL